MIKGLFRKILDALVQPEGARPDTGSHAAGGRKRSVPDIILESIMEVERRNTAAHEAGHVMTAWFSPFLHITRARASGTKGGEVTSIGLYQYPAFKWDQLVQFLGGLAGDIIVSGRFTGGQCSSDLIEARRYALELVGQCADPESAKLWRVDEGPTPDFSKVFGTAQDPRIVRLMTVGYWRARSMILQREAMFRRLTAELAKREVLSEGDLQDILGDPVVADDDMLQTLIVITGGR